MRRKILSSINIKSESFKLKISTTDRKYHNTIYFELSSFITPLCDTKDYTCDMRSLKTIIREKTGHIIDDTGFFDNNFILNFEVPDKRMNSNKSTYMMAQIFLKCRDEELLNTEFKQIDTLLEAPLREMENTIEKTLREMNYILFPNRREFRNYL